MKLHILIFLTLLLFSTTNSLIAQSNGLELTTERHDDRSVSIMYSKAYHGSITVVVEFTNLVNCNERNKITKVVENYSGELLKLKPIDENQGIDLSFQYSYVEGALRPKLKKGINYVLPFASGSEVTALESSYLFKDLKLEEKPKNWYALHFISSKPDTVFAVRKGIVVEVVQKHQLIDSVMYTSNKNKVKIEHKDHSLATYKGYAKNGALVKPGQLVNVGDPIAVMKAEHMTGRLSLFLFYLDEINILEFNPSKKRQKTSKWGYLKTRFVHDKGHTLLVEGESYKSVITEELVFQEMSKREIKKYKKAKGE